MKQSLSHRLLLLAILSLFACKSSESNGSVFLGKWANTNNASDTIVITQQGDKFVIIGGGRHIVATHLDGTLSYNVNGSFRGQCSYLQNSDTLNCVGLSYKRTK